MCKKSVEDMTQVIEILFGRCAADWRMGNVVGHICSQLSNASLNDVKFRDKLLQFVQKKYGGIDFTEF